MIFFLPKPISDTPPAWCIKGSPLLWSRKKGSLPSFPMCRCHLLGFLPFTMRCSLSFLNSLSHLGPFLPALLKFLGPVAEALIFFQFWSPRRFTINPEMDEKENSWMLHNSRITHRERVFWLLYLLRHRSAYAADLFNHPQPPKWRSSGYSYLRHRLWSASSTITLKCWLLLPFISSHWHRVVSNLSFWNLS